MFKYILLEDCTGCDKLAIIHNLCNSLREDLILERLIINYVSKN